MSNKRCEEGKTTEQIQAEDEQAISKVGFVAHYDQAEGLDGVANYHTHGMAETVGHTDFQIALPIHPGSAHSVFSNFFNRIKEDGEVFAADDLVYNILESFPVKLVNRVEGQRPILRILFPDANKKFPGDEGCDPVFEKQVI